MADESQTPFHYLLGAWRRAGEVTRTIRMDRDPNAQDKLKVLAEIKRLCVSYAGLSLMMPDMFGSAHSPPFGADWTETHHGKTTFVDT
jgi:hypothetical protein